jgi:PIN domain nuclease of toxin-antitoxin system
VTLAFDTHALIWWIAGDDRLSAPQIAALRRAEARGEPIGVPAICFWEMAKLVERGRLELNVPLDDVFDEIEDHPGIRVLELTPRVALESTRLGSGFHTDPADQMIAATARVHGLKLVTADERIRASRVVAVV